MIESDTIKLLRECDAGVKMGVSSINDVLGDVKNEKFRQTLYDCRQEHYRLDYKINRMLSDYNDGGKEPNPMAKGMSYIKTNFKMSMEYLLV